MRIVFVFLFLPIYSFAQESIDANAFFAYGMSAYQLEDMTTAEVVKFPWINRYELRTETRDFDFQQQEYTLRLSPSTAKIRKAQSALSQEMNNAPDFDYQELNCDQLLSVHQDWLTLFMMNEEQAVWSELQTILRDKQTIYEKMVSAYEIDPATILKLQTEKSDLEITCRNAELKRTYLLNKYNIVENEIDFGDFISMEVLAAEINRAMLRDQTDDFVDDEIAYKRLLLDKEMAIEVAEKKQIFDFVQVKYTGPHDDLLQERVSIGMGLQLFNDGNTRLKMQEYRIEQEELNITEERRATERMAEEKALITKLQRDLQSYTYFLEVMDKERVEMQKLSDNVSQSTSTSPLLLLEIEARHIDMKKEALDMKKELLEDYLDYLQKTEKMCQASAVNFLSS